MGPREKRKNIVEKEDGDGGRTARFVDSIERFTGLLLDRIAESPSGKLMDEKETRMFSSVVMRSYKIWMQALSLEHRDKALEEKFRRLQKRAEENAAREDKD